ncbi:MAG: CRISPR-associated RAMP protein Csx10 [Caldilineaceae bacterium]|nr:CRISPR-associated RAMP protein Csx10 [Caldilineaceae bacterium]HRJ40283.1 CRISPR-associated RAMP protein Csx10 [Caldilineaceae bacterium]
MKELFYEIVAEAPLAINERKPGGSQFQEGLGYIPGRVVRGALATQVLRGCKDPAHEHNHQECPQPALCRGLFGEEILFGDAHPLVQKREGPFVLPATAMSCKDNSGFRSKGHGVFDTLIDRACWELLQPAAMQYASRCPVCGGRTKGFSGVYSHCQIEEDGRQIDYYFSEDVSRELLTRVAINRRRGVAEDELLYAINTLSQFVVVERDDPYQQKSFDPARYVGSMRLADDSLETLIETELKRVTRMGGGSSRGLGRVGIHVIHAPVKPALEERLGCFNATLAERQQLMIRWRGDETPLPLPQYFAVTLQSDAILSADGWQPDMRLNEAMLWRACGETGQPPADLRLVRCYTISLTRGGFQAAWGLPKVTELAVQAGAVFLYQMEKAADWTTRLERLEEQGVGSRRAEGFGRVLVCDPFHYEAVKEAK